MILLLLVEIGVFDQERVVHARIERVCIDACITPEGSRADVSVPDIKTGIH
jgi:hypothetical protein